MPIELHHLAQVGHHLVAPAVARDLQQPHVEALVDPEEAVPVAGRRLQLLVQLLQLLDFRGARALRHHRAGIAFQQGEEVVHLGEIALRDLGHVGAAPHLHGHQAFRGQHLEGLAQRRAADAVLLRQLDLVDPAPGLELAAEDALANELGDFLVEGAGSKRDGGHAPHSRVGRILYQ